MKADPINTQASTTKNEFYNALDGIIQPRVQNYAANPVVGTEHIALQGNTLMEAAAVYGLTPNQETTAGRLTVVKADYTKRSNQTRTKYFKYSPLDVIESARLGIHFEKFKRIYNLIKLPTSKWSEIIGISDRTMQNIIKEKRDLDQNKSEKLLAFLTLVEYALDVLGDETRFTAWLNYQSPALQGKAPIEYVDTFQGINMLKEQLFKIETGNLV